MARVLGLSWVMFRYPGPEPGLVTEWPGLGPSVQLMYAAEAVLGS